MLAAAFPGGGLRLLAGAIPITLLILFFGLILLISLALPKDRRDYVMGFAPIIVQIVRLIVAQPPQPRQSR